MPRTTPSSLKATSSTPSTTSQMFLKRNSSSSSALLSPLGRSTHNSEQLPTYNASHDTPTRGSSSRWSSSSRRFLRAAESGKGTLLPDHIGATTSMTVARPRQPPSRNRTRSSPSLNLVMNLAGRSSSNNLALPTTNPEAPSLISRSGSGGSQNTSSPGGSKSNSANATPERSLRRRATSCHSDDEEGMGLGYQTRRLSLYRSRSGNAGSEYDGAQVQRKRNSSASSIASSNGSTNKWHGNNPNVNNGGPWWYSWLSRNAPSTSIQFGQNHHHIAPSFNLGPKLQASHFVMQVILVLAVTILVWESHHKAIFATEQLAQFQEEESLLLLHLQKIEQQSIQLHENLNRLAKSSTNDELPSSWTKDNNEDGEESGGAVDFELIQKQTQQLKQMEEEINDEVRSLQSRIQQSARSHIVQEFGEGPVQVVLDLDFSGETRVGHRNHPSSKITILLWHDTPHAAWTWLEQIGRKIWDHSEFVFKPTSPNVLDAEPGKPDPEQAGKLEFIEQSQHGHEAWTVGLREGSSSDGLAMYINLQDNTAYHRHETCVGKIIDGFDALQRLLEASRSASARNGGTSSIHIRSAVAMHVTKHDGGAGAIGM